MIDQAKVLEFARRVIAASQEYAGDLDGAMIQDWAVEAGLLIPTEVTESCGEGCVCEEYDEFPMTCYRWCPELRGTTEASP